MSDSNDSHKMSNSGLREIAVRLCEHEDVSCNYFEVFDPDASSSSSNSSSSDNSFQVRIVQVTQPSRVLVSHTL